MANGKEMKELFCRYEGNPILTPEMWPVQYPWPLAAVFNPGATKLNDEVLLLVRTESREGYSSLTIAKSADGKTNWKISERPTLLADRNSGEEFFGLEDPRITWIEERKEYIIVYVSFRVGMAGWVPSISLISTKDFISFERLVGPRLIPPNKDAALFPRTIRGRYALIHRPFIDGRADIWVSFSPNLRDWGADQVLIPAQKEGWDSDRVGIGPPPIETEEGWITFYHGVEKTISGRVYRVGVALLDLETLEIIRRSPVWIFGPKEDYEMRENNGGVVFPCGNVVNEKTDEIFMYYGAADKTVGLSIASLKEILNFLKSC